MEWRWRVGVACERPGCLLGEVGKAELNDRCWTCLIGLGLRVPGSHHCSGAHLVMSTGFKDYRSDSYSI